MVAEKRMCEENVINKSNGFELSLQIETPQYDNGNVIYDLKNIKCE